MLDEVAQEKQFNRDDLDGCGCQEACQEQHALTVRQLSPPLEQGNQEERTHCEDKNKSHNRQGVGMRPLAGGSARSPD